jgi:hypothetical protein
MCGEMLLNASLLLAGPAKMAATFVADVPVFLNLLAFAASAAQSLNDRADISRFRLLAA